MATEPSSTGTYVGSFLSRARIKRVRLTPSPRDATVQAPALPLEEPVGHIAVSPSPPLSRSSTLRRVFLSAEGSQTSLPADEESLAVGGGGHNISFFGSACLLAQNIATSGMLQIPGLFQSVGWLPATAAFLVVSVWSTLSALFLARLIQRLPGNAGFTHRIEFGRVAQTLLPRWAYLSVVLILCAAFISQNISNIIVSAQTIDDALISTVGTSCALALYPQREDGNPFFCIHSDNDDVVADSPFDGYVVSVGYLILAASTLPLSYIALDSNVIFQIIGMVLVAVCVLIWVAQFCALGLQPALLPIVGTSGVSAYFSLIPTVVFNYGFVATVPSWLNEKGPRVPPTTTIWAAVGSSTVLYVVLGIFGALAVDFREADLLTVILFSLPSRTQGPLLVLSQLCCYLFTFANLVVSIPVVSIIVRYNIVNAGLMPLWGAHVVAVGVPWVLSLFFYAGNQLNDLQNWSSALFFVLLNLVFPLYLYWLQTIADKGKASHVVGATGAAALRAQGESGNHRSDDREPVVLGNTVVLDLQQPKAQNAAAPGTSSTSSLPADDFDSPVNVLPVFLTSRFPRLESCVVVFLVFASVLLAALTLALQAASLQ